MYPKKNKSPKDMELLTNTKRAITTAFIGAIAEFEKSFGYIWGQGKEELSDNQKKFLDLWRKIRLNIMNLGNEQCRIMEREFEKFNITYEGRYIEFKYKPRDGNRRIENGQG